MKLLEIFFESLGSKFPWELGRPSWCYKVYHQKRNSNPRRSSLIALTRSEFSTLPDNRREARASRRSEERPCALCRDGLRQREVAGTYGTSSELSAVPDVTAIATPRASLFLETFSLSPSPPGSITDRCQLIGRCNCLINLQATWIAKAVSSSRLLESVPTTLCIFK